MLFQENKSNPSSQTTTETSNEIKLLQDISKTIDKLLTKRLKSDKSIESGRNNKINSVQFGNSLQHRINYINSLIAKKNTPVLFDDLTEITITDVITDDSLIPKAFKNKDDSIFNLENIIEKKTNNFKWTLMAPDSSYKNAFKFNELQNLKKKDDITEKKSVYFPLLRVDSPLDSYDKETLILDDNCVLNLEYTHVMNQPNNNDYNFLISPEKLMSNLSKKQFSNLKDIKPKISKNGMLKNRDFFLKNMLQVNFETLRDESYVENPLTNVLTSTKLSPHIISYKEINLSTPIQDDCLSDNDENKTIIVENSIQGESISDTVLYHGYILTPDYIKKSESKEMKKKLPLNEIMNDGKKSSIKEFLNFSLENDSIKNKNNSLPILLERAPLLPPDLLGNIRLTNGNDVKKFLSVQSVDDPSWNDFEKIILDDNFNKYNEKENDLSIGHTLNNVKILDIKSNFKDELTSEILEDIIPYASKYNIKNNIVKSLNEMDKKINEMENISTLMENNFANSKKIILSVNHPNLKVYDSNEFILFNILKEFPKNNQISIKKSLRLVNSLNSCNDIQNEPEFELTKISSDEIINKIDNNSQVTEPQISDQEFLDSFPKLNFIEFKSNDISVLSNEMETIISGTSSYFMEDNKKISSTDNKKHIWNQSNNIRTRNIKERNQQIYSKRMKEAHKLASKILNEIGLPNQSSADITLHIPHNATPNEMMLNQLHRKKYSNILINQLPNMNDSMPYKPIRHVSFKNKVKLQRPEITRRQNDQKPLTYTDQLLALQPQFNKKRLLTKAMFKNIVEKQYPKDLTPRSIISQDTEINSLLTDWSVPDSVKRLLNENTHRDGLYIEDFSQMQSVNSNSVIDWDQISEMLQEHEK